MRDDITTIPISEIFDITDGCPVCRLRDELERRTVDFILGGAMMEPDVRITTNRKGFCRTHYSQMLKSRNKLAVALILDSHLAEIDAKILPEGGFLAPKTVTKFPLARAIAEDCFVCERVENALGNLLDTTIKSWQRDADFQKKFAAQPMLCLPHYHALCATAEKALGKKTASKFIVAAADVTRRGLTSLRTDVRSFCDMHDYRSIGKDMGHARDSVERAIKFLSGRE